MRHLSILFSLLFIFVAGCEQPSPQQATQTAPESTMAKEEPAPAGRGLFHQPTAPELFELPNEALASWRAKTTPKPALVLYSFDPLLKPIDPSLRDKARELALNGTPQQLRQHGTFNTAEPLILPIQTVSAAIDLDLFAKIYWVFPSKVLPEQLELEKFQGQLLEQQILAADEAAELTLNDGIYQGTVRGVPFEAIHYQKLADISGPIYLHIDMGFFRGLYDNEIESPIYPLQHAVASQIRAQNWQPLATSMSYSTLEGAVSLDVRFVINNFAELMRDPKLLDSELPKEWQLRSESLYTGDMDSNSKRLELSKQMIEAAPESAAAHYDYFQAQFMLKQLQPALDALAAAVERDSGYAASYFELSQMALTAGNPVMALDFLSKGEAVFPENNFVPMQKAHLLILTNQFSKAKQQLEQLPAQWSPLYHAKVPAAIAELEKQIEAGLNAQQNGKSNE